MLEGDLGSKGLTHKHVVPHISLYGPFLTRQQRQVVAEIIRVCSEYEDVPFIFKGFNYFDNSTNKVIYLDIDPSEALVNLRFELAKALLPITSSKSIEDRKTKKDFKFHSTIAFKDIDTKFNEIWGYMSEKDRPNIKQHLLRVTILKNGKILYEYDLIQQKLLNRGQALDKHFFMETIKKLKTMPNDNNDNFVEREKEEEEEDRERIDEEDKRKSLWERISDIFR